MSYGTKFFIIGMVGVAAYLYFKKQQKKSFTASKTGGFDTIVCPKGQMAVYQETPPPPRWVCEGKDTWDWY